MKFALKLFCIGLLAAGFAVTGCDRVNEAAEEATAEETEEATDEEAEEEEEAADEEEEAAEEEEEAAEEDAGTDAGGEDAGAEEEEEEEEGAAADDGADDTKQAAKKAPTPKQPPLVGTIEGTVGGGGVTDGKLQITVTSGYKANGVFSGKIGDKPFRVAFSGSVQKGSNSLSATGGRRGDSVRVSGKVMENAIGGKLSGKINDNNLTVRYTIKK